MAEVSLEIATKIESALYVSNGEEISREYGKRFRDLQSAMRNEENVKLRLNLLTGDTLP